MMGGGQDRREMFTFVVTHRPVLDPRTFHMPSKARRRQATTVSYSCTQYIARSKCIWLIKSSKTERACANRYMPACWILLDLEAYGLMNGWDLQYFFRINNQSTFAWIVLQIFV